MIDFVEILRALLVEERGHTPENADRLIKTYTSVVTNGIMARQIRATAIALEMADSDAAATKGDA